MHVSVSIFVGVLVLSLLLAPLFGKVTLRRLLILLAVAIVFGGVAAIVLGNWLNVP